ncbi:MAG: hypothetical protein AMJ78_08800 [Omnitrophica WOR_2 bacterium SM23_29]|nr:MAG: hypothetical protein AMJ78_08800 [Omnitrophica WOR_2 bacterium SM23_29]
METSIFIARIFGLCYLIIGAGLMFNRKAFQQVMDDFCKNAALVFYGGILALVIGVVIILIHNVWVANWTVIITIIGWLALIKGIWLIVFPNTVSKFMQAYQKNESLLIVHSIGALIFGAVLTFFGFFVG